MPLTFGRRSRPAPWELRQRRLARAGGVLAALTASLGLEGRIRDHSDEPLPVRAPFEVILSQADPGDQLPPMTAPPVPVRPAEFAPPGVDGSPDLIRQDAQVIGQRTTEPGDPSSIDPMADEDQAPEEASPPTRDDRGEQPIEPGAGAARAARTGLMTRAGFMAGQIKRASAPVERADAVKASPYGEDGGLRVIKRVAPRYDEVFMKPRQEVVPCLYEVSVAPSGIPEAVRLRSCPSALEAEARRAVAQWRWVDRPGEYHNVPVDVLIRFHPPERRRRP